MVTFMIDEKGRMFLSSRQPESVVKEKIIRDGVPSADSRLEPMSKEVKVGSQPTGKKWKSLWVSTRGSMDK